LTTRFILDPQVDHRPVHPFPTRRSSDLDSLANQLSGKIRHVIVLRGGMGRKQREAVAADLAAVSTDGERVLVATGRYIGEGFDEDRKSTRLNSSHVSISYAVFCLKKKTI